MKKNYVIVVLVIIALVLGFFLFKDNESSSTSSGTTPVSNGETKSLADSGLEQVPMSVFEDKSNTNLDVSGNNLTGALPAEIRKLSSLVTLDASNNNLTGIPAEIGQLSKLELADFSNNDISGLPLEIGNLSNLETLDLRGNPNVSTHDISLIQPKIPSAKILVD